MSKSEFDGDTEIYTDDKVVYSFSVEGTGPGRLAVDRATIDRWRALESQWEAYQNELRALADSNPSASEGCVPNRTTW